MLFTCCLQVVYIYFSFLFMIRRWKRIIFIQCFTHCLLSNINMLFTYCFHVVYILCSCCLHVVFMLFTYCFNVVFMFASCLHMVFILFSCCLNIVFMLFTYFHIVFMLFDGSKRSGSWNMPTTNYAMALLTLCPLLLSTSICLMDRGGLARGPCLLPTIHTLSYSLHVF